MNMAALLVTAQFVSLQELRLNNPSSSYHTREINMKYGRLGMIALAALTFGAMPAHAQFPSLSLMGGVSFPKGDASQAEDMGYNGAMGLNFSAPLIPIGVRLEAGLSHFPGKTVNVGGTNFTQSMNIWNGTVDATYGLPLPLPVKPYAIAGLGYYGAIMTVDGVPGNTTEKKLGYNAGVGVSFTRFFAEVRYHHMNTDNSAITYMPLTFGITF
jgi:opacity protein-like surface antigen